ncbi:hypothetical protein ACFYVE_17095 [Streptomyces tendae]
MTKAHPATKIGHATATRCSAFRGSGITFSSSGGCSDRNSQRVPTAVRG